MRRLPALLLPALLAFAVPAGAQETQPPAGARPERKIERVVHEDAGSRIEEWRHGGEVERITVQPRADMPAYEIEPASPARSPAADARQGLSGAGGQRRWNVLRF